MGNADAPDTSRPSTHQKKDNDKSHSVKYDISNPRNKLILDSAKKTFLGNVETQQPKSIYSAFPENIYLHTLDGQRIGAFLYKPQSINARTHFYIMCHGKGCDRIKVNYVCTFGKKAEDENACFILPDYRGFADSSGEYTIGGVNYDILAASQYLRSKMGARSVSIIGHSLGAAIALEFARFARKQVPEHSPRLIYVLSPFTTTVNICRDFKAYRVFTFLIPRLEKLIKRYFNYSNVRSARRFGANLHVFHGSLDKTIALSHGVAVAESAGCSIYISENKHINILSELSVWTKIFAINRESS